MGTPKTTVANDVVYLHNNPKKHLCIIEVRDILMELS